MTRKEAKLDVKWDKDAFSNKSTIHLICKVVDANDNTTELDGWSFKIYVNNEQVGTGSEVTKDVTSFKEGTLHILVVASKDGYTMKWGMTVHKTGT